MDAAGEEAAARGAWVAVGLLFAAGVVNFLDRSSLAIANGPIRAELHLSATEMGALLSTFSLAYGFAQLPVGRWLDRYGTRRLLGAGLVVWSLAQVLSALVRSFGGFVPLRVLLGVGEAPFFPGGVKSIQTLFGPDRRGLPMGVLNASSTLGLALAPPLLTVVLLQVGWRWMFGAIGALGLVLAAAWWPLYREAPTAAARGAGVDWWGLLRQRTVWGMVLGFSGVNYTAWLYLAWLPGYLQVARHLSLAATGWVAAVPFLCGAAGMFASGAVADGLVRAGREPIGTRKALIVLGMVGSAGCTWCVAAAGTTAAAVGLISAALFLIHFAGTAAWGLVQFAAPARLVGTVGTLQNFGSFLVASAAPVVTGWLLDRTHSFGVALSVCSGVTLAGALLYFVLVRGVVEG